MSDFIAIRKNGKWVAVKHSYKRNARSFITSTWLPCGKRGICGCLRPSDCLRRYYRTNTYFTWANMLQRCLNPNAKSFKRYGGRGISVCEKWMTFGGFFEDMGVRPAGLTLERKNNSKGYFKSNCRWATRSEQMNNTSRNIFVSAYGARLTIGQWSKILKLSYNRTLEFFDID